jgi:hypothetical protein
MPYKTSNFGNEEKDQEPSGNQSKQLVLLSYKNEGGQLEYPELHYIPGQPLPSLSFQNEEKRLKHSKARLIPKYLWEHAFNSGLAKLCLPLMEEDLSTIDLSTLSRRFEPWQYTNAWLAMAVSHPQFTPAVLEKWAISLGCDPLEMAILIGRQDMVDFLIEKSPDRLTFTFTTTHREEFSYLQDAATRGQLDILKYLVQLIEKSNLILEKGRLFFGSLIRSICLASNYGHLNVIKYLMLYLKPHLAQSDFAELRLVSVNEAIECAAGHRHWDVVKYLLPYVEQNTPEKLKKLYINIFWAMSYTIYNNSFSFRANIGEDLIQYLEQNRPDQLGSIVDACLDKTIDFAVQYGSLDVVDFLMSYARQHMPELLEPLFVRTLKGIQDRVFKKTDFSKQVIECLVQHLQPCATQKLEAVLDLLNKDLAQQKLSPVYKYEIERKKIDFFQEILTYADFCLKSKKTSVSLPAAIVKQKEVPVSSEVSATSKTPQALFHHSSQPAQPAPVTAGEKVANCFLSTQFF